MFRHEGDSKSSSVVGNAMPTCRDPTSRLWLIDGETVSFYGFPYPTRTVIVRLSDDRLWVWSPMKLAACDRLANTGGRFAPSAPPPPGGDDLHRPRRSRVVGLVITL
jgi:hypothetical protein